MNQKFPQCADRCYIRLAYTATPTYVAKCLLEKQVTPLTPGLINSTATSNSTSQTSYAWWTTWPLAIRLCPTPPASHPENPANWNASQEKQQKTRCIPMWTGLTGTP
jgi:hypothetical protein